VRPRDAVERGDLNGRQAVFRQEPRKLEPDVIVAAVVLPCIRDDADESLERLAVRRKQDPFVVEVVLNGDGGAAPALR